jgi:hypothetical protein
MSVTYAQSRVMWCNRAVRVIANSAAHAGCLLLQMTRFSSLASFAAGLSGDYCRCGRQLQIPPDLHGQT